jgi:hypothetical protein
LFFQRKQDYEYYCKYQVECRDLGGYACHRYILEEKMSGRRAKIAASGRQIYDTLR